MQAMMDQTYSLADFFSHVNNHCFTASYMLALLAVTIMRTENKRQMYFHIFEWLLVSLQDPSTPYSICSSVIVMSSSLVEVISI